MAEKTLDNGGPAFPVHPGVALDEFKGMSLRDWFAGMTLQGFLAAPEREGQDARLCPDVAAKWAYEHADAMLRVRGKK